MKTFYMLDRRTNTLLPIAPVVKEEVRVEYFTLCDRWLLFLLLFLACLGVAYEKGLLG